jgi:hypothetical protein
VNKYCCYLLLPSSPYFVVLITAYHHLSQRALSTNRRGLKHVIIIRRRFSPTLLIHGQQADSVVGASRQPAIVDI